MKKSIKVILFTGIGCICLGGALAGIALARGGWYQRETVEQVTHSIEMPVDPDEITADIQITDANVTILPSENGRCYAVCDETAVVNYILRVNENEIHLEENDNRKWYDYIGIMPTTREIVLYLPSDKYQFNIDAKTNSGNITCSPPLVSFYATTASGNISCSSNISWHFNAKTNSGNIDFINCDCRTIDIQSNSGNVMLDHVASPRTDIRTKSGDISVARYYDSENICYTTNDDGEHVPLSSEMSFSTTSGDIDISLLEAMHYFVKSSSGDIICPEPIESDTLLCAESKSGDITITLAE